MMSKIRILHIVGSMERAGIQTWLMEVLRRVDRSKYQMDFLCLSGIADHYASDVEELGGRILLPPNGASMASQKNLHNFHHWFSSFLAINPYDIVHSHVLYFSGFVLRLAFRAGVPIRIAHAHSTGKQKYAFPRESYTRLMRFLINRYATSGLAVSRPVAERFFGSKWQSDSRWNVLYYGFDFSAFTQAVSRNLYSDLGVSNTHQIVGHVGRFTEPKNHAFLLDLAEVFVAISPDIRLLLIGDGELRRSIELQAEQRHLKSAIVFAGMRTDVPAIMLTVMDVLVLPSLWEGLAIVALEAQAAGLRCVLSDRVPFDVRIIDEAVEFVPLNMGPEAWADRVSVALERGHLDRQMTYEKMSQSRFALDRCVSQLESHYLLR